MRSARRRVCHVGESRFQSWVGLQGIAPRIAPRKSELGLIACEVSLVSGWDSGGGVTSLVAAWGIRSTMVSR